MSDDEFSSWQIKLLAGMIIIFASNAGFMLNKSSPEMRSDPFTGTEGRDMERRLDRVDAEQQKMIYRMRLREDDAKECRGMIQEHLRQHP